MMNFIITRDAVFNLCVLKRIFIAKREKYYLGFIEEHSEVFHEYETLEEAREDLEDIFRQIKVINGIA